MKKPLLLLLLMLSTAISLNAEQRGIVLLLADGNTVSFTFSENPVILLDNTLQIVTNNGDKVNFDYNNVTNIRVAEIEDKTLDDITNPLNTGSKIMFHISDDGITVEGMPSGEHVSAYTVNGIKIASAVSNGNQSSTFLRMPAKSGMYIIRTSTGVTYKYIKRNN